MAVKTYSKAKDGAVNLTKNFKIREFACSDGSDKVLISDELVTILQKIRDHFGKPVNITSAYRTSGYNAKIGGAKASQHVKGTAADIMVNGVDPLKVALYAQSLGIGGVGLYSYASGGFTHVDVRKGNSRWVQPKKNGSYTTVPKIMPVIKNNYPAAIMILQRKLNFLGFECGAADGIAGTKTIAAIKRFQTARGLVSDGIAGDKTWCAIAQGLL